MNLLATNLMTRSVNLSDGTILAAAGTDGSSKQVESISDRDQVLVDRGLINISEVDAAPVGEGARLNAPRVPAASQQQRKGES